MKCVNLDTTLPMVALAAALATLLKLCGRTASSWVLVREKQHKMECNVSMLWEDMTSRET